jgi:PAS domain S-box-containing protein
MATILIVDDHESNRDLLTTLLGYRHHQTVEARDGMEGLDLARTARPDLIITDILMPSMDGYEFTRRLRNDPAIAATPVVFYSAHYLMQEAQALSAKCGVKYVVAKPAEPEELLRTVDAALGTQAVPAGPVEDFDRDHIRVLTDKVSQQAGQVGDLSARLEALIAISGELNVAQAPPLLLERYCSAAREVIGAVCASACITDERGGESGGEIRRYCSGSSPANGGEACGMSGSVAKMLAGRPCRRGRNGEGQPVMLGCGAGVVPVNSYLVVPILTRNRTYGWMGLGNKIGHAEFTAEDERLLTTLAAQLAVGYENSRLFEELKTRAADLEHEVVERRLSAEKYRIVVEQASDGIIIGDQNGNLFEVNSRMLEMVGHTREEFLGMNLVDLILHEDQVSEPLPFDMFLSRRVFRLERRFIRRDGSLIDVEIGFCGLEDGRMQAIVRDVAERKRLETELRQSQKLEAVGRLAGGVAHDFNNLLTVILGQSDLVLNSMEPGDRRRREIEDIRSAGGRAATLTSQLLAFSRKQVLQPKVLNVNRALANLSKMLERLISSNIEVIERYGPETWRAKVDPGQLDQVILNLALNARDAMPLGGKLILETANHRVDGERIEQNPEVPPGEYVMLAVTDTGSGMDAETQSHLFEPFFTTKAPGKGTGLGLSTVYGIVRQSGGYISVASEPGTGTTMKVYLPRTLEGAEPAPPREEYQPLPIGSETVLIAEDEEPVRALTATVLGQLGYYVLQAGNGEEALGIARGYRGEIHLLLTDIVMPKMNGNELAIEIRRDRPGIKVLFSSGYTGDVVAQQGALDPTVPFLQKPFTPRTLSVKVREALGGRAPGVWPDGQNAEAELFQRTGPGVSQTA